MSALFRQGLPLTSPLSPPPHFLPPQLEAIARLIMNDGLDPQLVDDIKEDLDFYLEAYADDPDFLER